MPRVFFHPPYLANIMLTVAIRQLFTAAVQSLKSAAARALNGALPPGVLVEFRCARRIDALTRRLVGMQRKIANMSAHVLSGSARGAVDADHKLRRMLAEFKQDLNGVRRELATWHTRECRGRTGALLAAAIERLNRIAADTYMAADRLGFEIDEHDRRFGR
ncbi:hypothetical protein GCM10027321_43250 [Massilia terrae]